MRKLALLFAAVVPSCGSELPPPAATAAAPRVEAAAPALPSGRTPEERRAIFRAGIDAEAAGRFDAAEAAFARSVQIHPQLADHARAHLARLAARRGDHAQALQHWTLIAERQADSIWRGEAALALADAAIAERDVATAARWLAIARADDLRSEIRSSAAWRSSQLARRRGNLAEARALAAEVRAQAAGTPEAREAASEAWAERNVVALASFASAEEEVNRRLREGDPAKALELVREAEARFADHPSLPDLWLLEATALARNGPGENAIRLLEEVRRRSPRHPAAASALYRLASGAWNRDDDARALQLFGEYDRLYPNGTQAAEALYAAGRIDQEAQRWDQAARRFARLVSRHKQSTLAAESDWRVGWSRYRARKFVEAATAFAEAASRGHEEAASLYWRGRSLDRSGRSGRESYAQILERFPGSYYALRAEERLSHPIGDALRSRILPEERPSPAPPFEQIHWTRAEELRLAGLLELAHLELDAYLRATPIGPPHTPWLVGAWQNVGGWHRAIRVAIRENACAVDKPYVRACYPLGYWPEIRSEASRRGLDANLVASLIRQESLFDDDAHSPANARGLMQLLPTTAQRVAKTSGSPYSGAEDLYRPEINLPLGTAYLAELLARYQGSTISALAGYNAGEGAVAKWQQRYPGLEEDEFVESISYRETRNYVKKVLQNRRLYRTLYGPP